MASKTKMLFVFSSFLIHLAYAVPECGVKEMVFNEAGKFQSFAKSLFKDAEITLSGQIVKKGDPDKKLKEKDLSLNWYLLESDCAQYFFQVKDEELRFLAEAPKGQQMYKLYNKGVVTFKSGHLPKKPYITLRRPIGTEVKTPTGKLLKIQSSESDESQSKKRITTTAVNKLVRNPSTKTASTSEPTQSTPIRRKPPGRKPPGRKPPGRKPRIRKRDVSETTTTSKPDKAGSSKASNKKPSKPDKAGSSKASKPGADGNYLLMIRVQDDLPKDAIVQVKVSIKMSTGYLSAAEWPLLPFYGAMSLVYLAYGVVWLIVSACQWRELLRIQFWIGGVIALGMLEKAILFSEYNNVNDTGVPAHGLVVLALVLSCIKRTLSRILIIIVSMGFGIVKPRLGGALHRVLGVGCLYFILCVVDGSYREFSVKADVNRKQIIASVPLSVLDAVICWWIFTSLLQTMRTLRIRKNLVKLSLYRHFTNILVVSVIASVAFMVWVIKAHSFNKCIKDWKEIWIDDAFWHFLFALILLAIMVLWRPTANNQRYAFTPLIDVGEDDDDDMTLSDAFHGMKMRSKRDVEAPDRAEKQRKKAEDDLKWVEENIPTSGGIDTALPSLLDSDEEMMTTKLEMSKME